MAFLEIRHPSNEIRTNIETVRVAPGELWLRLPDGLVSFGRGSPRSAEDAHVQVVGEDTLSRRHCSITRRDGNYVLVDQGSTGGTFLNDERADQRVLRDGDVLHLGAPSRSTKAIFRTASAPRGLRLPVLARAWLELWTSGDPAAFDALHAERFVDHSAAGRPPDRGGFRAALVAMRTAFPDLRVQCEDILVAEDRDLATVRWSARGTHRAIYLGVPPRGQIILFRGIEVIRFESDRVIERWGEWDGLDLVVQLRGESRGPTTPR